jgi:hypothetical protein
LFTGLDDSPPIALLSAFFANSVNLEGVARRFVTVTAANFLFDLPDFLGKEFDRRATLRTYHVVMASAIVLVLVTGNAVVKSDFARQPATSEKFQSPVDGGKSDARVSLLNQSVQFVDGKMLARLQKRAQDGAALLRLLQADPLQMPMEDALSLANILARDGQMIVNSLLQHVRSMGKTTTKK